MLCLDIPTHLEGGTTPWHSDEQVMLGFPREDEPTIQEGIPLPDTLDDEDSEERPMRKSLEAVLRK